MTRLAVLGGGSWGTTFAQVLADSGAQVTLWARREEVAREIREEHRNRTYLGGHRLPAEVTATSSVAEAVDGADGIVVALPAQSLRPTLTGWRQLPGLSQGLPSVPVLSLVKGIERGTDSRISEVLVAAGGARRELVGVLSGPNLSAEILQRPPCGSVIAAPTPALAHPLAGWCHAPYLRAYTSTAGVGVGIDGATTDVSRTASPITRGLAEITRLGVALAGRPETFAGLAGMGDLVATCASPLSRNHRLGLALGSGLDVEAATAQVGQTAEGVATARAVDDLAGRLGVEMPITRAVVDVVDHDAGIEQVTTALLSRSVRPE